MIINILNDIKTILAVNDTDVFDDELLLDINSIYSMVKQIISISDLIIDKNTKWTDINFDDLSLLRIYITTRVRKMFDPPASTTAMDALNSVINESEWRLYLFSEVKHASSP